MNWKNSIPLKYLLFAALTFFTFTACASSNQKLNSDAVTNTKLSDEDVIAIAQKAYAFGYPMILMDYTRKIKTNVERPNSEGSAPVNQIGHLRQFPDDTFDFVVKPNVDTYYSMAWFDLKAEPVVLSVPATERYYVHPLYDAYSNVFFVSGPRTTGTGAHTFLITGPFWKGDVPKGMVQVKAPTNMVWLLGRTQVNNEEDGNTVVAKVQDALKVDLLSNFGQLHEAVKGHVSEEYKSIVPVGNARALSTEEYFTKLAQLMVNNPPADIDSPFVKQMKSIGLEAGKPFTINRFSPELITALNAIPAQEHEKWISIATGRLDIGLNVVNNWLHITKGMDTGAYGTNYDYRALIGFVGLGANLAVDAVYPTTSLDGNGNTIVGENNYVIHFAKEQLPPVNAFWSLTAYNSRDFLIKNPINRFAIGDRSNLKYNEDGSLDIYIQNSDPKGDKTSNWLPSTQEGLTNLTLRLYWPKKSALNNTWVIPAVEKVE